MMMVKFGRLKVRLDDFKMVIMCILKGGLVMAISLILCITSLKMRLSLIISVLHPFVHLLSLHLAASLANQVR